MISGQRPFRDLGHNGVSHWVLNGRRPNLCDFLNQQDPVQAGLLALAEACWSGDPESRPTMGAVVERLERLITLASSPHAGGNPMLNEITMEKRARKRKRSRRWHRSNHNTYVPILEES